MLLVSVLDVVAADRDLVLGLGVALDAAEVHRLVEGHGLAGDVQVPLRLVQRALVAAAVNAHGKTGADEEDEQRRPRVRNEAKFIGLDERTRVR